MTRVLFRKANEYGTTGIWLATVDDDLREFCPRAYGRGISMRTKDCGNFGICTLAINFSKYSLQLFKEIKK